MCGRYSITKPVEALRDLFALEGAMPAYGPRYNIAPSQGVPVVRLEEGVRRMVLVRWGLVPRWAKQPPAPPPINARSESAAEKPMFRDAFARRRCLVPASGFYEWRDDGGPRKQPYYIHPRDGAPLAFAGLWERWTPPAGEAQETMAILTTGANAALRALHDRMPVILRPEDWAAWLAPSAAPEALQALLHPASEDLLVFHPVGHGVNRVANDTAALVERLGVSLPLPPRAGAAKPGDGQLDLF